MFSGIIQATGKVVEITRNAVDMRLKVESCLGTSEELSYMSKNNILPEDPLITGESIAVNGVCLTLTEHCLNSVTKNHASSATAHQLLNFFVSQETLERTNLSQLELGSVVNLERALKASERISGHLVQGHVDGLATFLAVRPVGDAFEVKINLPELLLPLVVEKGSIALDGISLTINKLKHTTAFLMIIPHTWNQTNLSHKIIGQDFNVEVDMIAKYVRESLKHYAYKLT